MQLCKSGRGGEHMQSLRCTCRVQRVRSWLSKALYAERNCKCQVYSLRKSLGHIEKLAPYMELNCIAIFFSQDCHKKVIESTHVHFW